MYCKKCGSEIDDSAAFCKNCGAAQQTENSPVIVKNNNGLQKFMIIAICCFIAAVISGISGYSIRNSSEYKSNISLINRQQSLINELDDKIQEYKEKSSVNGALSDVYSDRTLSNGYSFISDTYQTMIQQANSAKLEAKSKIIDAEVKNAGIVFKSRVCVVFAVIFAIAGIVFIMKQRNT